jgi:hypothetical protein
VEFIPSELSEGTLYISIPYATATHLCACGCGERVVTPFSATDWSLTFDGETISLTPSIGNWSFDCQSHYWVRRNQVDWARGWSREQIDAGRARDRLNKLWHLGDTAGDVTEAPAATGEKRSRLRRLWQRIRH